MTITKERCLKPTVGGGAPPHGSGGRPTPRALAHRAGWARPGPRGRARSRPTRASPRQAGPGPRLRPQAAGLRAAAPWVEQPRVAALRAGPPTEGGDLWSPQGAGARDFEAAPLPPWPALPHLWVGLPNFGDSVVVTARPAQRSEKTIGAA
jgi:hypothetical protein